MQNAFTQLGGTRRIHTSMISFSLDAHHVATAFRAALRHVKYSVAARVIFIGDYFYDFGDHVTTALNHRPVAVLHFQTVDFILIVERPPCDRGAADEYRLERGYRR